MPAFDADRLQSTHDSRAKMQLRWQLVRDFYEAEVWDLPERYLTKYKTSEGENEYTYRKTDADYTNHLARIIDGFSGMLFSVEHEASRQIQRDDAEFGLGEITDTDTVMGKVARNLTGDGTNYLTQWRIAAPLLLVYHELWGVVRSPQNALPQHAIIRPETVIDLMEADDGRILEVKTEETVERRTSLAGPSQRTKLYTHYTLDGYTQYEVYTVDGKNSTQIVEQGEYEFYDSADRMRRILPIYRVRLPLPRYVAWTLAKKAKVIYNKESQRDHILTLAQMPMFMFDDEHHDVDTFIERRREGVNVVTGTGHDWLTVDSQPAEIATNVLRDKIDDLYHTAFQSYSDQARQVTATEMRQDFAQGIMSFLVLYKNAVDEYENEFLKRLEQIEFPERPDLWGQAHVQRSSNFEPADVEEMLQRRKQRYFGSGPVPVDPTTKTEIVKDMLREDGYDVTDERAERISEAVQAAHDRSTQAADVDLFG